MYTQKALDYFGQGIAPRKVRSHLAEVAGVTRQSVFRWIETGNVPLKYARILAKKSGGKVEVELDAYDQEPAEPGIAKSCNLG